MMIPIQKVIVRDRIRKDYGDIKELADDIRENGLINPPVVNKEYELLAGERRLKACKSLGWEKIPVTMMDTRDAEHELNIEISENDVRKGFSKAERADYMKRLLRIEEAKAYERKVEHVQNSSQAKSRDKVSERFGISHDTMRKEMQIVENKDLLDSLDFADWDEGKLSTNKAYQKMKAKEAEKEREIRALKEELRKKEESAKSVERNMLDEYDQLQKKYMEQGNQYRSLKESLNRTPEESKLEEDAESFIITTYNFIKKNGGFVWVAERVEELPENKLKEFKNAVYAIDAFARQMVNNIGGYDLE